MSQAQWVKVGRVSGVYGIKGWIKVHSYTTPPEQIKHYQPWRLELAGVAETAVAIDAKISGKTLLIALQGVDDRDQAARWVQADISVPATALPELPDNEYYWYQLEGLRVISRFQNQSTDLGCVERLLETGANDVLVVQGDTGSIDERERLIPYVLGQSVLSIDLERRQVQVDWDPDF